ncbi:13694_t:CDS:2 [Cetraspora pellucida]|uniref:13694_t:CDS:1 n=1 Tax=Cetraspora pellucida TaxID=1433469 RepID=A0A9N9H7S2_9GLOM|nr:13694_t:CDS:2 [Cetraspora pellucida]
MSNWFKTAIEQGYIRLFEFDSFEDLQTIDRGGFGTVYSAYSKNTEQTVALKSLHNDAHDDDRLNKIPIDGTPEDFISLYSDAWNDDPNLRPNITEIRDKLKYIREQEFNRSNRISDDYTNSKYTIGLS